MRTQSFQVIKDEEVTERVVAGATRERILKIMEYLGDPFPYNTKILSLLIMLLRMLTLE